MISFCLILIDKDHKCDYYINCNNKFVFDKSHQSCCWYILLTFLFENQSPKKPEVDLIALLKLSFGDSLAAR